VVAVDKPAGSLTVPSRLGAADPRPCVGRELEASLGRRLWPIHRLDFEVSGLVLFATSAAAHRIASVVFEGRRVHKVYEALTEGADQVGDLPADFEWRSRLVRGKRRSFEAPHGSAAHTRARALQRVEAAQHIAADAGAPVDLLHFRLEPTTGRPHQLRVHLARAGFPVAGDTLYGARSRLSTPKSIALRATALQFSSEAERTALGLPPVLTVPGLLR
jgi:23S rRNA-/tRNA-specific pseudouridylate synthase